MKSAVLLFSFVLVVSYSNAVSPPKPDGPPTDPSKLFIPFPPTRCGPICRMYCPNGFVKNSLGCPICKCKPGKCPRFTTLISCRSCKYGRTYYTDKNGCRRCRCKTTPVICPKKRCLRRCTNGYRLDSRGCNTCTCKPTGGRPCRYGGKTYRHGTSYKRDCNTCFCRNGRSGCTKRACNTGPCRYGGKTYRHGTSYKRDCNTCFCRNGRSGCTKRACNTDCPKRKCKPCPLNLYRQDSKRCQTCTCRLPKFPQLSKLP